MINLHQATLQLRGVKHIVVSYSGGNDEGNVDDVRLVYHDGQNELLRQHEVPYGQIPEQALTEQQLFDNELLRIVEQPVWDQWGGFSGEFSVWGEVVWDVATWEYKDSSGYDYDEEEGQWDTYATSSSSPASAAGTTAS